MVLCRNLALTVGLYVSCCLIAQAAQIGQLEQAWNGRTFTLLVFMLLASLCASPGFALLRGWNSFLSLRLLRAFLMGPVLALTTLGLFITFFGIEYRLIEGNWNPEEGLEEDWAHEIFSLFHDTLGLFVGTGLKYFWPWPLIVMALIASVLAFLQSDRAQMP